MTTILLTNDDGIESPGLWAAVEAVLSLGKIIVIAPSFQQTGTGRGLFGDNDLCLIASEYTIKGVNVEAYHCNCSPALIVRHSLRTILQDAKPDLLISGINYGENLGFNITSSGTVGAALEGASQGIPGIAISQQTEISSHQRYTAQDWSVSVHFLKLFAASMLGSELPDDVDLLKIDVPSDSTVSTKWKLTTLAKNGYYVKKVANPSLHSKLGDGDTLIDVDERTLDTHSDIYALAKERVVSVTPISLDMTSRVEFDTLRKTLSVD